jgi:hypothetical protein
MNPVIQEANLQKVFVLILVILIIYYAFTFLMRFIIPSMMRKYVNNMQQKFTQKNQHSQDEMDGKKEGEISIKYVNKDKNNSQRPDDGEYVDYEEIK